MALTRPTLNNILTNVVAFADPITVLHSGATSANVDVGFLLNRANGLVSNVAIYWSESAQSFVTAFTSNSGATDSNISPSSYANLTIGNLLMVNGGILNVTGNINANTVGTHYGNVSATGNVSTSGSVYANSFFYANGTPFTSSSYGNVQLLANLAAGSNPVTFGSNIVAASGTTSTSTTTGALVVTGGAGFGGNVVADQVHALNNGNGTNFRVGDDVWIGDINVANTSRLMGQQDATQGYLVFGSTNTTNYIGRTGSNPITVTGAFATTGNTDVQSTLYGRGVYDNGTRVASTSGGPGNLSIATGNITMSLTGPGVVTTGGSTAIPVITTDAYGRISATSTAVVVAPAGTLSGATLNSGVTASSLTSVGILTGLTTTGTVIAATVNAATIGNSGATLTGTLSTAAQTNITSVGNLTTLSTAGTTTSWGNIVAASGTASTSTSTGALIVAGGAGIAGNVVAPNFYGNISPTPGLASIYSTGHIVPTANVTYDLGTNANRFRSLYLSGSTIYLGNATITTSSTGDIIINNTGSFAVPVGTTDQRSAVQGAIRYNTTISAFESYDGSTWNKLAYGTVSDFPNGDYGDLTVLTDAFGVSTSTTYDCNATGAIITSDLAAAGLTALSPI